MSWDGNGAFSRTKDWTNDRDADTPILASRHDENDDELRDGIGACLTKDGQSKATADFKPNADAQYSLGSTALRWVNAWISGAIKFKQATLAGTVQQATLTADRTHTLPDVTGVLASTGAPVISDPDYAADSVFALDASASAPGLLPFSAIYPTGVILITISTTAASGWLLLQGGTIGNAASSGTVRANADTAALFTMLWNSIADAYAPVSSGRGANAAADYAANKTITLPNAKGRSVMGLGQGNTAEGGGAGSNFSNGSIGGAETHTLTIQQMAYHFHDQQPETLIRIAGGGVGADGNALRIGGATSPVGNDQPHNNLHPFIVFNYMIKL